MCLCSSSERITHTHPVDRTAGHWRVDVKQASFAPIIRSVTHIKGCARPAHTNKHHMPAFHVKSAISKHREKEARDKAGEADRQEKLKKQIKDSVTCGVCYNPFKSSHKHIARMLACGHSFCSLCLEVDLPLTYISRDQPLACPLCRKKFPGDRYLAPRNYALMDIAEALSDAENPDKRVGAGDRSPSQKTLRRSARLQGATMAPA